MCIRDRFWIILVSILLGVTGKSMVNYVFVDHKSEASTVTVSYTHLDVYKRQIVECPNTIRYSEYKRFLIGKTVEDLIFEAEQLDEYQYAHLS